MSVIRLLRAPYGRTTRWQGSAFPPDLLGALRQTVILEAAIVLWFLAIAQAKVEAMAGFGLLNSLPVTFFGAIGLVFVGFAVAVSRDVINPRLLGAHVVALAVMLHGTTALLYDEPRYLWTYKHLGVTNFIAAEGHVNRAIDIYQNWPGFFALARGSAGPPVSSRSTSRPMPRSSSRSRTSRSCSSR